jgi:hypothetical protein
MTSMLADSGAAWADLNDSLEVCQTQALAVLSMKSLHS